MAHQRPAPMDARATEEMNLKVMTRIDPATEEILASAGHVAVYDFVQDGQTWTRKDVEGSLFLQKRRSKPVYQFTILNKKSQCNFSEELAEPFTFEEQNEKYLLYRNVHGQVACLWFHSADDCAKVARLMRRVIEGDLANGSQHAKSAPATAVPNGSADDSFWDQASSSNQAKQLQSTDAALDGGAGAPPGPSSGPLQKLFSNIKLAPGVTPQHRAASQPQQPQQQPPAPPQQQPSPGGGIPMPQRNTRQQQQQQQKPAANGAPTAARVDSGGLSVSPSSPSPAALGRASAGGAATPGARSGPPARPPLLTPSFFKQQSASQRESAGAASPLPFSLGGASQAGAAGQRGDGGGRSASGAALVSASAGTAEAQQRAAVRRAMLALAEQDAFLDMVGAALQQAGFRW